MARSISVVVPLYNGRGLIGACLESVPDGVDVIVVDDGSTDGAPELVAERFPGVRLLRNEHNAGFGATANRGLASAGGDVRIVLNSDARLLAGAIDALVAAFDDPDVGIAGPRLQFPDGSHQLSAAAFPTVANFAAGSFAVNEIYRWLRPGRRFRWESALSRADHAVTQDVDWVKGACFAISRECFEAVGGFDPGYRMYVEECDLCWRAKAAGWRVRYVAEARAEHIGGGSGSGDPARQARLNLAGEARFMARAYGPGVLPRWRMVRLASSTAKCLALGLAAPFDRRVRARLRWHATAVRTLARRGVLRRLAGPMSHEVGEGRRVSQDDGPGSE